VRGPISPDSIGPRIIVKDSSGSGVELVGPPSNEAVVNSQPPMARPVQVT
jgi:hypothetical protein